MRTYGTNSSHGPKQKTNKTNIAPNVVRAGSLWFNSESCLLSAKLLARFRLFPGFLLPNHWPEQTMCSSFLLIIKNLPLSFNFQRFWYFIMVIFSCTYRCIVRQCIDFKRIIKVGVSLGWELIRAFHLNFVLMDGNKLPLTTWPTDNICISTSLMSLKIWRTDPVGHQ